MYPTPTDARVWGRVWGGTLLKQGEHMRGALFFFKILFPRALLAIGVSRERKAIR